MATRTEITVGYAAGLVQAGLSFSLIAIGSLPEGSTAAAVAAFAVAGLGCSALLPLTISFAQADLVTMSAATAGMVIAAYQLGYGIAAFGAGPLQDAGVGLPALFGAAAVAAGVMAALSFAIAGRRQVPVPVAIIPSGGST
jgi:hypothetical protein